MRSPAWLCMLGVVAGCARPQATPPVATCPSVPAPFPAAVPDPLPPVSAARLTLRPAHWDWTDGRYVWTPAEWVPRPTPHPLWQDGFWVQQGGTCVWSPGHFLP
jgi:hypothetical protein